jgi:hypothetical protein
MFRFCILNHSNCVRHLFLDRMFFFIKQPKRWLAFWETKHDASKDGGVLALDMVENEPDLYGILGAITTSHQLAPTRTYCMHCKCSLRSSTHRSKTAATTTTAVHCRHCSRFVCSKCCHVCLPNDYFVKSMRSMESSSLWTCIVCEKILTSRREVMSNGTQPTTTTSIVSYGNIFFDDDEDRYSC